MESGREVGAGPQLHTDQQQQQTSCSCSMLPIGRGGGAVHADTCPKVAPVEQKFSTVPNQSAKHAAQAPPTSTPPTGLLELQHGVFDQSGGAFGSPTGGQGTMQHPINGSLEDVRAALIGRDCDHYQSAANCHQLETPTMANQIDSSRQVEKEHHFTSPDIAQKSFVNELVNRSFLMVNLNPNANHESDASPIMNHQEEEPRSFEHSLESSPEPPEMEAKKKSSNTLNPVGPMEFIERYRNRNSSQRPLVGESFSSSKHPFGETGSIIELKEHPSVNGIDVDISCAVPNVEHEDDSDVMPERGQWSGKLDFIFSCISYAVGLGNVWRFPYLCYENGGGAFLIPYLICVCVLGVPLFLMEVSLGQYLQSGGVAIWNRIPILKGIGFASMVMIGLCNTYYIVIIAWTLYYLFNSFRSPLPWSHCGNGWNTQACHEKDSTHNDSTGAVPPSLEFWNNKVLSISGDLTEIGDIQWHLFATLILAWILVYLVIYRGIHQSGKIIWFTAMFPYVILIILFGYGVSLSGASDGIEFYLSPKWHMLGEAKIWVAAGTQLLFTYGIGIGTNIALGSYNTFNHNFFRDSLIACLLSSGTSLFSGFVIFSVLGHLAESLNTTVAEVARSGPGLAFIVYPEAVARLPVPNLWAILFFIMLLVLGIDSQFCTVESFVTGIVDEWPRFLRPRRQLFTAVVVLVHFILGIVMITEGGMYVFQLMDNFSASGISLIIVVLLEIVGFCWIYGAENIYHNMCKMLGFKPWRMLYYLWVYISPLCLTAILIFSIVQYHPPEYAGKPFPWYGQLVGWLIASASIICIPLYVLYYMFYKSDQNLTFKERLMAGLWPDACNESTTDDTSTGSADLEKASARELLDSNMQLSTHFHHAHNDTHHHGPHHVSSKTPFTLLTGSNSTLSTSIADQSFNTSAQNINGSN